jgi:hypothetical protein
MIWNNDPAKNRKYDINIIVFVPGYLKKNKEKYEEI